MSQSGNSKLVTTVRHCFFYVMRENELIEKNPLFCCFFVCFFLSLYPSLSAAVWGTPHLYNEGAGSFIDSGLDNLFCLSVNCDVDSVFTVSAGFEGGLSRLLRRQMSTLQRLICLIRLAAPSIPAFIYLLTYLLTYSFTYLCLDLV